MFGESIGDAVANADLPMASAFRAADAAQLDRQMSVAQAIGILSERDGVTVADAY
jgi:hypothetical protein